MNVLHRTAERTEAELTVREELCNRRGVLHGGAVMALGDTLGGLTASVSLPNNGRPATIDEIAVAALFLADPENSYMNGHILTVDGGWTAGYTRDF